MLTVTERAITYLAAVLLEAEPEAGQALRIIPAGSGELDFILDSPRNDDQVVSRNQQPVLMLDPEMSRAMDGITLDAMDLDDGPCLTLGPTEDVEE